MENVHKGIGRCSCGLVEFGLQMPPLFRAFCHCSLCQSYNNADRADVSVYYARDFALLDDSNVAFKAYKQPRLVR